MIVRLRAFLLAAALVLPTSCGGGDDSVPTSSRASSVADLAAGTTEATGNEVGTTLLSGDTVGEEIGDDDVTTTLGPDVTTFVDVTDAEPWRVSLADPTGPLLDDWLDRSVIEPAPTDPPEPIDAQLTWIYEDLIELWRDDLRLVAVGLADATFDSGNRAASPGSVVDILGSAASMLGDSYAVIAAGSELAARPGTPGEPMFTVWTEYAQRSVVAFETIRAAMAEARRLEVSDQLCFVTVFAGDDGCDGPGAQAAAALTNDVEVAYRSIDEVDLNADIGTYASWYEFDQCAAWDAAAASTGLTPTEQQRIWLALDDNNLDVYFAGLSDCARESDGPEDPVVDEAADLTAWRTYLEAVADAIVTSGYEVGVADMSDGAEDERRYYEATSAGATGLIVSAARDAASHTWSSVSMPRLAIKLYLVAGISIDDWIELGDVDVGWDELDVDVCDAWSSVVAGYPADQLPLITAAVDDLDLAGSLLPERCG